MGILLWIASGIVAGIILSLATGDRDAQSVLANVILATAGACLGGIFALSLGYPGVVSLQGPNFGSALIGSVSLLVYGRWQLSHYRTVAY